MFNRPQQKKSSSTAASSITSIDTKKSDNQNSNNANMDVKHNRAEPTKKISKLLERRLMRQRSNSLPNLLQPLKTSIATRKTHSAPIISGQVANVPAAIAMPENEILKIIKKALVLETKKAIRDGNIKVLNILIGPDLRAAVQNGDGNGLSIKLSKLITLKYSEILLDRLTNEVKNQIKVTSRRNFKAFLDIYQQTIDDATKEYSTAIGNKASYYNNHLVIIKAGDRNYNYILNKFRAQANNFLKQYKPDPKKDDNLEKYCTKLTTNWLAAQNAFRNEEKIYVECYSKLEGKKSIVLDEYTKSATVWLDESRKSSNLADEKSTLSLFRQCTDESYEKMKPMMLSLLSNTNANYLRDTKGSTLLDLAFTDSKTEVINFLIKRGVFHITSHILTVGIDKIVAELNIEQVHLLINQMPAITDFKKNIIIVVGKWIKDLRFYSHLNTSLTNLFFIKYFYNFMPGIMFYTENEYSTFISEVIKLAVYIIESFHHESEETLSKYIQGLGNASLPASFRKELKACCHNLWEIDAYGIKSKLISDEAKYEEIRRLSTENGTLREEIIDIKDQKDNLEAVLKTQEEKYKSALAEKDVEIRRLQYEQKAFTREYTKRQSNWKKIYGEQLAIKEKEIVSLKTKKQHYTAAATPSSGDSGSRNQQASPPFISGYSSVGASNFPSDAKSGASGRFLLNYPTLTSSKSQDDTSLRTRTAISKFLPSPSPSPSPLSPLSPIEPLESSVARPLQLEWLAARNKAKKLRLQMQNEASLDSLIRAASAGTATSFSPLANVSSTKAGNVTKDQKELAPGGTPVVQSAASVAAVAIPPTPNSPTATVPASGATDGVDVHASPAGGATQHLLSPIFAPTKSPAGGALTAQRNVKLSF